MVCTEEELRVKTWGRGVNSSRPRRVRPARWARRAKAMERSLDAALVRRAVRLSGLAARPDLNHRVGTVEALDLGRRRYRVKLPSGEVVSVLPSKVALFEQNVEEIHMMNSPVVQAATKLAKEHGSVEDHALALREEAIPSRSER